MSTEYKIVVTTTPGSFLQHAFGPAIDIAQVTGIFDTIGDVYIEFSDESGEYKLLVKADDTKNSVAKRYSEIRWGT